MQLGSQALRTVPRHTCYFDSRSKLRPVAIILPNTRIRTPLFAHTRGHARTCTTYYQINIHDIVMNEMIDSLIVLLLFDRG